MKHFLTLLLCLALTTPAFAATEIQDEGTSQGYISRLNCVGTGLACSRSGIVGTITLGAGGAFMLPNGATPTVDAFGEVACDNNYWAAGRGSCLTYDGTAITALIGVLGTDTPTNGQTLKWNTGGTITWENDNDSSGATIAQYQVAFASSTNVMGGDTGMTFDPTTNILTVAGGINAGTTTGVNQTGSNGKLTWQGAGDGADENFVMDLNTTVNHVAFSSTTGVTEADFGTIAVSSTRLEGSQYFIAPASTTVNISEAGSAGVDTTDDQWAYYGAAKRILAYTQEKCFTLENPVTADDNIPIWTPVDNITTTGIYSISVGNTTMFFLGDGTNNTETITADTDGQADDGSIVNGTFTAGETVKFSVAYGNTATTWVNVCQRYTIDSN